MYILYRVVKPKLVFKIRNNKYFLQLNIIYYIILCCTELFEKSKINNY